MKPPACTMTALVEAKHDGRLGDREAASLGRHLVTCTACRELERELDEVRRLLRRSSWGTPESGPRPGGESRSTPLEHQRGRLALLRAAATPAPAGRGGRQGTIAFLAALTVAGVLVAWAAARSGGGSRSLLVALHLPLSMGGTPKPPAALRGVTPLGQRWGSAGNGVAEERASYPAETTIHGSAEARFDRHAEDRVDRVALTEGTLDLAVRRLAPGERFLVATRDAEVEVRGTRFEVEAHAGRIARVAVSEGKVEVRYGRAVSVIAAGGAWQPPLMAALEPSPEDPSQSSVTMGDPPKPRC